MAATPVRTQRDRLIREMKIALGGTIVDIELEEDELNYCIDITLDRYRQRSGNSIEESFVFLDVQTDVATYTLPNEVQEVRSVYRNVIGSSGGAAIDPFSLAFTNNIYMIQNPAQLGTTGAGLLATYDFAMQYQSLIGRMFGRDVQFTWDASTKKITFHRRFGATENVGLHCFNARPEEILLNDVYAKPWLRSMAIANAKMLMGQARSKFQTLAGPQGGVTLNGNELKQEAQAEMDKLEEELKMLIDQSEGYGFIIG
jgi:uncharacterized membrane protein YkoI